MFKLFSIGIILITLQVDAFSHKLEDIRKSFHKAVIDQRYIPDFKNLCDSIHSDIAVIIAYKAVSDALNAQISWNPIDKLSNILQYQSLMLEAVEKDPTNLEIRFLRFCVEYHIPRWLNLSNHITEDKDFFLANADYISRLNFDPSFSRYISYFIKQTGHYSEEDARIIESKLVMK